MAEPIRQFIDYLRYNLEGIYLKLLVAFIILLTGAIIGKLLGKLTNRILHEIELDNILKKATGKELKFEKFISSFAMYLVYFITIIMVLNQLNVTTTVLQMILAAVIIIIIISVILAIKDFVPNAFAGLYIYRRGLIKEGETINLNGIVGKVAHINLVETKLETKEGDLVYVPNSTITKKGVMKVKGKAQKKLSAKPE